MIDNFSNSNFWCKSYLASVKLRSVHTTTHLIIFANSFNYVFSLPEFNIQSELITNITITDNAHRSIQIDGWMDYVQCARHSSKTHNNKKQSKHSECARTEIDSRNCRDECAEQLLWRDVRIPHRVIERRASFFFVSSHALGAHIDCFVNTSTTSAYVYQ